MNGAATPETATPRSASPATYGVWTGKSWESGGTGHTSQTFKRRRCISNMRKSGFVKQNVSNGFGNRQSVKKNILESPSA